jgi:hypothetical protein
MGYQPKFEFEMEYFKKRMGSVFFVEAVVIAVAQALSNSWDGSALGVRMVLCIVVFAQSIAFFLIKIYTACT